MSFALKHVHVYFLGIKVKIVTDCNVINAIQNKRDLLPRIARWWISLQDFSLEFLIQKRKIR